jgi:hypothetical protein
VKDKTSWTVEAGLEVCVIRRGDLVVIFGAVRECRSLLEKRETSEAAG